MVQSAFITKTKLQKPVCIMRYIIETQQPVWPEYKAFEH